MNELQRALCLGDVYVCIQRSTVRTLTFRLIVDRDFEPLHGKRRIEATIHTAAARVPSAGGAVAWKCLRDDSKLVRAPSSDTCIIPQAES